ncbi:MAG: DsbA family protein [Pseudomonadota bacterium]
MDQLRIYFHFRSPYSRLGLHVIAQAKLNQAIDVRMIPFTKTAGDAAFLNPTDSMPKIRYMMEDAPRMAARMGLPFSGPRPMEVDYGASLSAFYVARAEGLALPFALAISDARWGAAQNISDPELLKAAGADVGVVGDVSAAPDRGEIEADEALIDADGVFGVPFATLDLEGQKKQRFWGQDRFALLVEALG